MRILNVTQGSREWLEVRAKHFCASDAPAMMGVSQYKTRTELLRQKATGDVPKVDAMTQALFDRGHETEAAARQHIEAEISEELYPTTGTDEDGYLLASFDGITMDGVIGFEHKLWNAELAAEVNAGRLPPAYYWQLEQQILIAGLNRVIFVCSDGTPEKMASLDYFPVPGRAEQLLAGWKQFAEDLKSYQHVEEIPAKAGKAIMELPALNVQLVGEVKSSNLIAYRATALAFIQSINTALQTDQDFADAEKTVKFCGDAEAELEAVKKRALGQTASIDELFRTVDMLREEMRGKRLELEKLVKARKEAIREEIRRGGMQAYSEHITALNNRLGKAYMPPIAADFSGVMKGKKTITSLRDAVATELARVKIEANAIADKIDVNLKTLAALGHGKEFLFSDVGQIVQKANDDFTALVKLRLAEHKAKEEARIAEEQERISKEIMAKLEAKAVPPDTAVPTAGPLVATPEGDRGPAPKPVVPMVIVLLRPTDDDIIAGIALHYRVRENQVIEWLLDMDLTAAWKRRVA